MQLTDRIKKIAEKKGLTFAEIERQLDFGNGTLRRWDKSSPASDKLLKLANLLDTTTDFLLTGDKDKQSTLSPEDVEWLELIHRLPREEQLEFKGELKGFLKHLEKTSVAADDLKKTGTDSLGK